MIDQPYSLFLIFAITWAITFVPCWWLLIRLLALSVSDKKPATFFVYFLLYRLLIILPYAFLLILGADSLPHVVQIFVIGFVIAGLVFSFVRFFMRNKVITALWWVYGFCYDGLLYFAPYKRLIRSVIDQAELTGAKPRTILELGSGTGNVADALAKVFPPALIVGVDNSSSMIGIARKKNPSINYVQADILEYLDRTEVYDLIVMQNSLYAVEDRRLLWERLYHIVSNDGAIVITNSDKPGSASIIREHFTYGKWYHLLHPKLLLVGLIDNFISQLSQTGTFSFVKEANIRQETDALFVMSDVKRVYGGVNILFSLKPKRKQS